MTAAFQLFNPEGLYDPSANAYSHVAEVPAGSRLLFIAGQGGEDIGGALSPVFAEQARQALEHVFKLTLLIVDHSEEKLRQWVAAADQAWGPHMKPTCSLIPVPRLALDGMQIEIEAVAAL